QYNWVDISSIGTPVVLGLDSNVGPFPLGFTFSFYGNDFTSYRICSHGFLSFTSTSVQWDNAPIPAADEPNNLLAGYWDDIDPSGAQVYRYENHDSVVVSYIDVPFTGYGGSCTFQIIILAKGEIIYQYENITGLVGQATIGIENADGTIGLQVAYNQPYVHDSLAVLFTWSKWLFTLSGISGTIAPGDSAEIVFMADFRSTTIVADSTYEAIVYINYDSPYEIPAIPFSITASAGSIAGTVTDANTTLPIEGAIVTASSVTEAIIVDTTDAGGNYHIDIAPGDVSVTVEADGYVSDTAQVAVAQNQTTTHNVALTAPMATVDTSPVVDSVAVGDTAVYTRTLYNTGSAPMYYNVGPQPGGGALSGFPNNYKIPDINFDGAMEKQYPYEDISRPERGPIENSNLFDKNDHKASKRAVQEPIYPPQILSLGGPDGFGYYWIDSDEPGGPQYNWVDISSTGTPIVLTDDDIAGPFNLGFDFDFYGESYSQFWVCSNGFGSFIPIPDPGGYIYYNNLPIPQAPIPGDVAGAATYGFWDDLDPETGGEIRYYAANDSFVVSWLNVPYFWSGGPYTFQIIIIANGKITYQYQSMNDPTNSATIGIQNGSGTIGLQVAYNQPYVHDALAVLFTSWPEWLPILSGSSGTIAPGDSAEIVFMADLRGTTIVADRTYEADAYINNSGPYGAPVIPFSITCFAPAVVSVAPSQSELDVALSTNISVTFNTDIDPATVNDSTFLVSGMCSGPHSGTITYDAPSKTATFDPAVDFAEGEIVTAVLTDGIESSVGVPISDYAWSFTVESVVAPGTFFLDSAYAVGANPRAVISADLDGDGDLDLATCNSDTNRVSILLNNGDGIFAASVTYEIAGVARSIFSADLDGDGDLDLAAANNDTNSVSVIFNNGDGTFGSHYTYTVYSLPLGIVAADLNGDGYPDLVTCSYDNVVSVLMNNGDGTFAAYVTYAVHSRPMSIFSADLDNDGDLDLATANRYSNDVSVLMNNGDGTFALHVDYPAGALTYSLFAGDLDGDGYVDMAAANHDDSTVSVLLNNGDGTFAAQSTYDVGNGPFSVFASDLDGDGDLDLATANPSSCDVSVLMNNGDGTFAPQSAYAVGCEPNWIFSADLNGDGKLDLATSGSDGVSVLFNLPFPKIISTVPSQNELNAAISADISVTFNLNMDETTINSSTFLVNGMCTGPHEGIISYDSLSRTATFDPTDDFAEGEIVTAVLTDGIESSIGVPITDYAWSFTVESAFASASFVLDSAYAVETGAPSVISADINGDGHLDLVAGNFDSNSVSVLLNNGDGTFATHVDYEIGGYARSTFSADFDGDGDLDLAATNNDTNSVSVLLNDGSGAFGLYYTYETSRTPTSVFAGDFNGDGYPDLAVAHYYDTLAVLLNNGNGSFATRTLYLAGIGPNQIFSADLDNDGDLDLATGNRYSDDISVLMNNGDGTFASRIDYPAGDGTYSVLARDLNGDGYPDLAAPNYADTNISVLLNNGDGTFAAQTTYATCAWPFYASASDLDGDGDLDLATANAQSDSVSVLLNNGDGTFAPQLAYDIGHISGCVFSADLNGDGRMDLAVSAGNVAVLFNLDKPRIVSTAPSQNGLDASVSTNISATFSIDMDPTTINDSTFLVSGMYTGIRTGIITYDSLSRTATFDPSVDFAEGEIVTVLLTEDIEPLDGVPLSDYIWMFTVESALASASFPSRVTYATGDNPTSVFTSDLDGDGDLDLAAANYISDNVSVLLNNGDGTFAAPVNYAVGNGPWSVFASDFDGDGDLDLATANLLSDNVSVLLNNGNGTFVPAYFYFAGWQPFSLYAADLDGDGDIDLAAANLNSDNVSVLLGNGDGTFADTVNYAVGSCPVSVFAADLDGDGDIDLATANLDSDNVSVLLNNGDGTFAAQATYTAGDGPWSVFASDFDGDGDLDLASANLNSDNVSVLLGNGDGTFADTVNYA
ncbi:MAG: VCBS repeat-containing protein, partial [Candidatus Zixiibacteriota bacterium]